MKKITALMLTLMMLLSLSAAHADTAGDSWPFIIRNGDRHSPMIAITMDDCYEIECVQQALELCKTYGITMTFFPLGTQIKGEDAEVWRAIPEAGCEIGSHSYWHKYSGQIDPWALISYLGHTQQALDAVLGYHYEMRWFRPPFGTIADKKGSNSACITTIKSFGYQHVVNWDVSQTDAKQALKKTENGSILLYHARAKDVRCLTELIPALLEAGFIPVTVSTLLGYGPNETGEELYVYNKADYPKK